MRNRVKEKSREGKGEKRGEAEIYSEVLTPIILGTGTVSSEKTHLCFSVATTSSG